MATDEDYTSYLYNKIVTTYFPYETNEVLLQAFYAYIQVLTEPAEDERPDTIELAIKRLKIPHKAIEDLINTSDAAKYPSSKYSTNEIEEKLLKFEKVLLSEIFADSDLESNKKVELLKAKKLSMNEIMSIEGIEQGGSMSRFIHHIDILIGKFSSETSAPKPMAMPVRPVLNDLWIYEPEKLHELSQELYLHGLIAKENEFTEVFLRNSTASCKWNGHTRLLIYLFGLLYINDKGLFPEPCLSFIAKSFSSKKAAPIKKQDLQTQYGQIDHYFDEPEQCLKRQYLTIFRIHKGIFSKT